MAVRQAVLLASLLAAGAAVPALASPAPPGRVDARPHVVVATLDTGTNPFHPTWRRSERRHPSAYLPGYPRDAAAARLSFAGSYEESVERSEEALGAFVGSEERLAWVPGTNIVGAWASTEDEAPVFDARADALQPSHSHGGPASSQIAGRGYGLAPDAYLVVMDRTSDGSGEDPYAVNARGLRWAADQPWIDVIHTNIQNLAPLANNDTPVFPGYPEAVAYAVSKGKLVVSAGGNFYAEPTETSPHAGPSGVLVAGANDNCGFSEYSNPDPHVVMDGMGTAAAAADGFGSTAFSGTSSASPRTTGYVADLLLQLRKRYGYTGGVRDGALMVLAKGQRRPARGPLADGRLTAAELHEVVRRTADPQSHASRWDGTESTSCIPQLVTGAAAYPKIGYGEVSEHTAGDALAVLTGRAPLPPRPDEDRMYEASEQARRAFWR
jgi:hypothetical protein